MAVNARLAALASASAKSAVASQAVTPIAPLEPGQVAANEAFTKTYSPWETQLKSYPARKSQEFFDRHDPKLKDSKLKENLPAFTPGAGTDAIKWAFLSRKARGVGHNLLDGMEKLIVNGDDDRMKAGWQSFQKMMNAMPQAEKALVESTMLDGGALVPPEFAAEFIYLLRASTVVLESGASTIQMRGQILNIGRQNAAGTAYYEGETQAVTASQQQFGQLSLSVKKLMALTPISNDLLRDGGPDVEAIVRDDLVQVIALRQDLAWISGDGTLGTPAGLASLINAANLLTATQGGSSATFQEIAYDVGRCIGALKQANVDKFAPESTWGWIMSPRSEQYLRTVSSTFGVFPFKDGMDDNGEFFGIKYRTTTALLNTLGNGGNASQVYLVAWPAAVVGMNMPLEMKLYPDGTAPDINGTLISGIASDMTWLRGVTRHDFKLRYDLAAVQLGSVLWGT